MPHLHFSPLTLLLAQIAAILVVSRALSVVTRWLGQPLVIAEVLAGIVLGPSLLGWLWPATAQALFPEPSLPVLRMLSQVGLVLFMFLIGLELDPKLLKGRAQSSIAISHSSIFVPFALGIGGGWWLHSSYAEPGVPRLPFVLFLGVSMSVTAFPVLARILSERQLLSSRVGAIAVACAAVDDVTAWCLLAFVVAVARAQGIAHALWTTLFAAVFIGGMLFLVRPFLARVGARVASREGLTRGVLAIVLLLLVVSSIVTELIGIHALFGAFLFGAILPKDGQLAESLAEKLETVAVILLLPLFFAYSGLRTEIGLVSGARDWLVTGALILLATLGKFGGSAVAARLTGLGWREASAIGVLMNTRGLMELIVLNIGLDLGVVSPTVFTMLVIMALVTTFTTTPVLRRIYCDEELLLRSLPASTRSSGLPAPFTIMMCVSDPTPGPGLATVSAALLGRREQPARLFAVHLWRPSDRPSLEQRRAAPELELSPLQPLLSHARELDIDVQPLTFVSSDPAADICRTAEEMRVSLVLIGAHKPLLLGGKLGGSVRDVLERAKVPVGVFIDRGLRKLERVLVAYAGGPEDLAALKLARRIAAAERVELTLFHVVPAGEAAQRGRGRSQFDELFSEPDTNGKVRMRVVEHDSPPDAVLEEAQRGYDLIVLGVPERWGLDKGVLSLRRRRVLAEAPLSILVVHPSSQAAAVTTPSAALRGPLPGPSSV